MTPQEQLEQLASQGASVNDLVSFLQSTNVPLDAATKAANEWFEYYRSLDIAKSLPAFDGRALLNQEISRLNKMFEQIGRRFYDPEKVWTTVEDWSEGITQNLLMFWREEHEPMDFPTGTRVKGGGYDKPGVIIAYGEVIVNDIKYRLEQDPYGDLTPARTEEQKDLMKHMAELIAVRWYDKHGQEMCMGFHQAEQLVKISESE